ncbi:MAG: xanthine dehydrogenase family protein molybdopterin-binding subunit, partial [Deltaproteobacteria bacterium]|nr:xanthine dehydrogenase family protein molybdopterin-binding subunit [Deltaproteobacteria bacterium]
MTMGGEVREGSAGAVYRVIGQTVPDVRGPAKTTGQERYNIDVTFPGMLHGKMVRSPYPHARVLRIDPGEAERMPGVVCVATAKDVGGTNRFGDYAADQPVLVAEGETAKMVGDPLALVA